MTNEQAIKQLNVLYDALNFQRSDAKESVDAINTAIKALKNQIPKEPIITGFYNGAEIINCGKCYLGSHITRAVDYCPHCGTKIDWEEGENE